MNVPLHRGDGLNPIKKALGDDVDYDEIRWVMATMEDEGKS